VKRLWFHLSNWLIRLLAGRRQIALNLRYDQEGRIVVNGEGAFMHNIRMTG